MTQFHCIATIVGHGGRGDGLNGSERPTVWERLAGRSRIDADRGQFYGIMVSGGYLLCEFDAPDSPSKRVGSKGSLDLEPIIAYDANVPLVIRAQTELQTRQDSASAVLVRRREEVDRRPVTVVWTRGDLE